MPPSAGKSSVSGVGDAAGEDQPARVTGAVGEADRARELRQAVQRQREPGKVLARDGGDVQRDGRVGAGGGPQRQGPEPRRVEREHRRARPDHGGREDGVARRVADRHGAGRAGAAGERRRAGDQGRPRQLQGEVRDVDARDHGDREGPAQVVGGEGLQLVVAALLHVEREMVGELVGQQQGLLRQDRPVRGAENETAARAGQLERERAGDRGRLLQRDVGAGQLLPGRHRDRGLGGEVARCRKPQRVVAGGQAAEPVLVDAGGGADRGDGTVERRAAPVGQRGRGGDDRVARVLHEGDRAARAGVEGVDLAVAVLVEDRGVHLGDLDRPATPSRRPNPGMMSSAPAPSVPGVTATAARSTARGGCAFGVDLAPGDGDLVAEPEDARAREGVVHAVGLCVLRRRGVISVTAPAASVTRQAGGLAAEVSVKLVWCWASIRSMCRPSGSIKARGNWSSTMALLGPISVPVSK